MDWITEVQKAINYAEENLLDDITVEEIANYVYFSSDYFNKVFFILTGISMSEYLRNRKLSRAGQELIDKKEKVIDLAFKYGYESPDSFRKAFVRFHGITPKEAMHDSSKLKHYDPLTIKIDIKGGFQMSRKFIPNVQKLYENKAENYMFPACMRSAMSALNENPELDFLFFAGITGDLFTQVWKEPKWQYNDSYSTVCKESQLPIKAAFDACGYSYEYVYKEDIQRRKHVYIQKIVESIDQGLPVLTFGIVGPPICSIICGYEENGEVLIGWAQFTDEPVEDRPMDLIPAENYFSVRNGLDQSEGLIFLKKKEQQPNLEASFRQTMKQIPIWASVPSEDNLYFGKEAFKKWEDSLLCDECFEQEDLLESPMDTYGSCMVLAGTNLSQIHEFLKRVREYCPDLETTIDALNEAYASQIKALNKIVEYQGGYFLDADRKALANKEFRMKLAELIKELGECYEETASIAASIK